MAKNSTALRPIRPPQTAIGRPAWTLLGSAPVPVAVFAAAPKTVSGCSGRHPACRRAVASSPAAKTVGQPHVPEHLATRQNPSVFFRAARMPALYVRQGCLTLRSAPVPVAVSAVAPELVSRATSPRPSPPTPVGGEPAGWKACPTRGCYETRRK